MHKCIFRAFCVAVRNSELYLSIQKSLYISAVEHKIECATDQTGDRGSAIVSRLRPFLDVGAHIPTTLWRRDRTFIMSATVALILSSTTSGELAATWNPSSKRQMSSL
jgi:hypothetical protein